MAEKRTFLLPDLGEGLLDAEIVEWHIAEGEQVEVDVPLVSMETAKAVVEVPSPYSGILVKRFGEAHDVIQTGAPLAEIQLSEGKQRAEAHDSGHTHQPHSSAAKSDNGAAKASKAAAPAAHQPDADSGTVVGAMSSSSDIKQEELVEIDGVRAMPAVRAMAKKLRVDLRLLRGSNPDGVISIADVKRAAALPPKEGSLTLAACPVDVEPEPEPKPEIPRGESIPLRGVRRNMARLLSDAHSRVVLTTIVDDAEIQAWSEREDTTVRLLRAIVRAVEVEPALNAWFDDKSVALTLHRHVDIGIAVDTEEGLFVPALRRADTLDAKAMRTALESLREKVKARALSPDALTGYTISLSNFGVFAGRYATPIVVPPCVAIIGAGKIRWEAYPIMGGFASRRILPISLGFDHRACTGGEAARFLRAVLDDLKLGE